MSFYPKDFTNSFTESFLVEVTKTITKEKNKATEKTEVDLEPTLSTKPVDDDDEDEALDSDNTVSTKKDKKDKKASVKEKYNVTFSDKEIAFFDSIINKEKE